MDVKGALLQFFVDNVLPLVGTIVLPWLLVGLHNLVAWGKAKAQGSKLAFVANFMAEAADSVVAEVEVTLVPQIKAAMADGKIDAAEGAKLKEAALEMLKLKVPPLLMADARNLMGPLLDTWLKGLLERANAASKVDAPPAPKEAEAVPQ
jgi:hypothetical protein